VSFAYPRGRPKADHPADAEIIDAALLPFVEELGGHLGEHNWKAATITSITHVDSGACLAHKVTNYLDDFSGGVSPINNAEIGRSKTWQSIGVVTGTTYGGDLWILVSWQIAQPLVSSIWGLQFAIRVNGVVIGESILGSGEYENDREGDLFGRQFPCAQEFWYPAPPGSQTVELVGKVMNDHSNLLIGPTVALPAVRAVQITFFEIW